MPLSTRRPTPYIALKLALLFLWSIGHGCKLIESVPPRPTIEDATLPWTGSPGTHRFDARVTIQPPYELQSVEVRFARHWAQDVWDEKQLELDWFTASTVGGDAEHYRAAPPNPTLFETNDSVRYQWVLSYTVAGGDVINEEGTPVLRLIVGCSLEEEERQLRAAQESILAQFDIPNPHTQLVVPGGGPILPHRFTSLGRTGVAFANTTIPRFEISFNTPLGSFAIPVPNRSLAPTLDQPVLLMYAPRPKSAGESDAAYLAALRDGFADPPYKLIGWNYGTPYSPTDRPKIGCIGSDRWMVHEAGWHMNDGAMSLVIPLEDVRGEANPPTPIFPVPPPTSIAETQNFFFPHPRFWDIHAWVSGDGLPSTDLFHPNENIVVGLGDDEGIDTENIFFWSHLQ